MTARERLLPLVLVSLAGCGAGDTDAPHVGHPAWQDAPPLDTAVLTTPGDTQPRDTGGSLGEAHVRFVHLIDDLPPLDVLLDATPVALGLSFGAASDAKVGYLSVPAGTLDLVVARSGPSASAAQGAPLEWPPVISEPLVLEPDANVTVLLLGSERLGILEPSLAPHTRVMLDTAQPYPGAAIVTLVHAAPAWPAFDVFAGPIPIAADLGFDQDTGSVPAPAGPSVLGLDGDGDGLPEQQFQAEMPDGAWLYTYLVPDPEAPPPNARMLLHVLGLPLQPVDALP